MRISDWSSDVCSSDLGYRVTNGPAFSSDGRTMYHSDSAAQLIYQFELNETGEATNRRIFSSFGEGEGSPDGMTIDAARSEEHTSELQSLMRISYAVFCLKKKKNIKIKQITKNSKRQYKQKHYSQSHQ